MANIYCTATSTGKGFFTHQDRNDFYLSGHTGDVYVVGDNAKGSAWVSKISGTSKTKAEAQAIVDGVIETEQAAFDASPPEEQVYRTRPEKYTLP